VSLTSTPAGFYPDPLDPYALRYWDGTQWTEHKAPLYVNPTIAAPVDKLNIDGGRRFVGPFRALFLGFRQYVNFTGRSSRSEYWWWTMWTFIAWFGAETIFLFEAASRGFSDRQDCATFDSGIRNPCESAGVFWTGVTISIFFVIVMIAMVLPTIAVLVRRLHDGGFSGLLALLMLAGLVPFVSFLGYIALWVLACFPTKEANRFGQPPTKGKPRRSDITASITV
jgi:uncharacterized membrane protein YhaH (DUF805 family)